MSKLATTSILLFTVLLQGCANYLYTGEITVPDADGEPRKSILYWPRTKGAFSEPKAGPAVLLTECGQPVIYQQRPGKIVFRGSPGMDRIPGEASSGADDLECGQFVGHDSLVDMGAGDVRLTVLCEGVTSEFSIEPRVYLPASDDPYTFVVTGEKRRSLFGKVPDAPATPDCR